MSTLSQFFGGNAIKSLQRGIVVRAGSSSTPTTVTISAVNTAKTVVYLTSRTLGTSEGATGSSYTTGYINLTSSTTIDVYGANVYLQYEVVAYE